MPWRGTVPSRDARSRRPGLRPRCAAAPPARVLEIGAGDGALAAALREARLRRDGDRPAAPRPARGVERIALIDATGSYDAAIAIVSLHHVEPLAESCAHLAELIEPGGVIAIDELDIDRYDERVTAWWLHQRAAAGHEDRHDGREHPRGHARPHPPARRRPRGARAALRARRARPRPVPAPLAPPAGPARGGGAPDRRGSPARDGRPDGRRQYSTPSAAHRNAMNGRASRGARLALVQEAARGRLALGHRRHDREALALDVLDQRMVLRVARRRALERLALGELPLRPDRRDRLPPRARAARPARRGCA